MAIKWHELKEDLVKHKIYREMQGVITPQNYGNGEGQWSLSDLIHSSDNRKTIAYWILDGVNSKGERGPGIRPLNIEFRFKVLSRQACCRDRNGNAIWFKEESKLESGSPDDIVAEVNDKPLPGDVVEVKGEAEEFDENGKEIDSRVLRRWAYQGRRPEIYHEFIVDDDGCISVPYPYALTMLTKHGKKITYPRFRKRARNDKTQRQITNWFFEEVFPKPILDNPEPHYNGGGGNRKKKYK